MLLSMVTLFCVFSRLACQARLKLFCVKQLFGISYINIPGERIVIRSKDKLMFQRLPRRRRQMETNRLAAIGILRHLPRIEIQIGYLRSLIGCSVHRIADPVF